LNIFHNDNAVLFHTHQQLQSKTFNGKLHKLRSLEALSMRLRRLSKYSE